MNKRYKKRELILIDTILRKEKKEDSSLWTNSQGEVYFFEHIKADNKKNLPLVKVYKDRQYLTGLFRTKKADEFSGDIKLPDGKEYLVFKVMSAERMQVFKKV